MMVIGIMLWLCMIAMVMQHYMGTELWKEQSISAPKMVMTVRIRMAYLIGYSGAAGGGLPAYFNGAMDDVRVLSANEVQALFQPAFPK